MRAREIAVIVGALVGPVLLGLALWSQAAAGPGDVTVQLFQFKPGRLEVKRGTVLTFTNQDDIRHTVTSGTPERPDGRFGAELSGKGAAARVTLGGPGVYPYFCDRHHAMRGEIEVQ